ncbi:hypothetical protein GQ43DRAFT_479268 [Delitschia confertaspora ATCC 74209]|uniref:Uncharacterized protein n=1 Tax=Delitschia confertaspora ATCC 74209 TaxID=1513339 RepID=A0A9P4JU23_9PLEO|nr:hypothetical protein GQ43DRAFT_479268 [Delitschia confertaspora ATCC 74209]
MIRCAFLNIVNGLISTIFAFIAFSHGLPAGAYTPRQIVESSAPLLETVVHHLGSSPDGEPPAREQLIENLASNLALNIRAMSITVPANDSTRVEMANQAEKIGTKFIEYIRATNPEDVAYGPEYVVRSPCEGHLLKPHVSHLMFGTRSLRHLMQIYYEYLHQMVLLRDSLLLFGNFEDVIIQITDECEMMTKQVTQRSIIKNAMFLLAPKLWSENAIAFRYQYRTVLPSLIAGGSSGRLLRYVSAVIDEDNKEAVSHNKFVDYYIAPRTDAVVGESSIPESDTQAPQKATLLSVENGDEQYLELILDYIDGKHLAKIDVGRAARGFKYAYFVNHTQESTPTDELKGVQYHSAWSILPKSGLGLVIPPTGIHVVRAGNKIELYALLGKMYPDNIVVMEEGQSLIKSLEEIRGRFRNAGRFVIEVRK